MWTSSRARARQGHFAYDSSSSASVRSSSKDCTPKEMLEQSPSAFQYSPTIPDEDCAVSNPSKPLPAYRTAAKVGLRHLLIILVACAPAALVGITAAVPTWWNRKSYFQNQIFSNCNYDGTFTPYKHRTLSLWDPSSFFKINLFWGDMTFSLAKFLDVGFDLIVGRCFQAVLAFITYTVSTRVLTRLMQASTVSYDVFEAIAFQSPSLTKELGLTHSLITGRAAKHRLMIVIILLSSMFVLAFPTLVSTMSGYSNNMVARFRALDGHIVPWSDVQVVQFTIENGTRLGVAGKIQVHSDPQCLLHGPGMPFNSSGLSSIYRRDDDHENDSGDENDSDNDLWAQTPAGCLLFWRTVQYISGYGTVASPSQLSEFYLNKEEIQLEPPTLSITTSYDHKALETLKAALDESLDHKMPALSRLRSVMGAAIRPNATFIYNNHTYDFDYVIRHAFCQPTNSHNWGFSFLFLFITMLLMSIWSVTMYILWLDSYLHSPIGRSARDMGNLRASWDLVEAMNNDPSIETVTKDMNDDEIRHLVRSSKLKTSRYCGGGVTLRSLDPANARRRVTRFEALKVFLRGHRQISCTEGTKMGHEHAPGHTPEVESALPAMLGPSSQDCAVNNDLFAFSNRIP